MTARTPTPLWLVAIALSAQLAGGCLSPSSVTCRNGTICPAGTVCGNGAQSCVPGPEVAACRGLAENADCTVFGGSGHCQAGLCLLPQCGDGVRNGSESCDGIDFGGKTCMSLGFANAPGLICNSDCTFDVSHCTGFCGDGLIGGNEACDGTNLDNQTCQSLHYYSQVSPLKCTDGCAFDTSGCFGICGDKTVNGPEQCDTVGPTLSCIQAGFDYGSATCSTSCQNDFDGCVKIGAWQVASILQSTGLTGVWGSGPTDVYAVGGATVTHWNGSVWSQTDRAIGGYEVGAQAVWGSGPSDLFVAGGSGGRPAIFHWNGSQWTADSPAALTSFPNRIWGSGPQDIYLLSSDGVIHGDGKSWSKLSLADDYRNIGGSGPDDVYLVTKAGGLVHWNGSQWTNVTGVPAVMSVWADEPDDLFAVGGTGTIERWNGTSWSAMSSGTSGDLNAVWGSGPDDVFAVGNGLIDHWDGTAWTPESLPGTALDAVWAGGWGAFAVGSTIERRDPSRWGTLPFEGKPPVLHGVWSGAPDDLFAVGDGGTLAHWDGTSWTTTVLDPTVTMRAVWGNGPSDVLAVGDATSSGAPTLAHWDGTSWSPLATSPPVIPSTDLNGVWSSSATNVYVVGQAIDRSALFHWDGAEWSDLDSAAFPTTEGPPLAGIWGDGPGNVIVYGSRGPVAYWDGTTWSGGPTGFTTTITSAWSSGSTLVAVTEGGAVWEAPSPSFLWGGDAPYDATYVTMSPLRAVRGSGLGDVFAAGDNVLFHQRGNIWQEIALPIPGSVYGLWVTPARVTLVGTMGELHLDRASVTCAGPERACNDGWDNDCDGLADAADPDCVGQVPENCANQIDDDGDGQVDCGDPDCRNFPVCQR